MVGVWQAGLLSMLDVLGVMSSKSVLRISLRASGKQRTSSEFMKDSMQTYIELYQFSAPCHGQQGINEMKIYSCMLSQILVCHQVIIAERGQERGEGMNGGANLSCN